MRRQSKHPRSRSRVWRSMPINTETQVQPERFNFIYNMGAHKHHCYVCLHTPQYTTINAHLHTLLTKKPPPNLHTHHSTKLLPHKIPIKPPPTNLPLYHLHTLPPIAISKSHNRSIYNKSAIVTHTPQHHTYKSKKHSLHLPNKKYNHSKKQKIQTHTSYKLISNNLPPIYIPTLIRVHPHCKACYTPQKLHRKPNHPRPNTPTLPPKLLKTRTLPLIQNPRSPQTLLRPRPRTMIKGGP